MKWHGKANASTGVECELETTGDYELRYENKRYECRDKTNRLFNVDDAKYRTFLSVDGRNAIASRDG